MLSLFDNLLASSFFWISNEKKFLSEFSSQIFALVTDLPAQIRLTTTLLPKFTFS